MAQNNMHFPQYRKLSNNKSFYRILDNRHWDELQVIGEKVLRFHVEAVQYPEILRIQDMLSFMDDYYVECSQEEFEELEGRIVKIQ